jgi:hypothetical protein
MAVTSRSAPEPRFEPRVADVGQDPDGGAAVVHVDVGRAFDVNSEACVAARGFREVIDSKGD